MRTRWAASTPRSSTACCSPWTAWASCRFRRQSHEIVPSAPLVPARDPTLMFVNAGMVQFKDVFTGREGRVCQRACSSQKCIRISGKHNDLENVGVTARHHTFFEMLGNFSFGDYFKEEAIYYAWQLLTDVLGVDRSRLVVTVFGGEGDLDADDEAAGLWRKISGLPPERILRCGMADNFWSMGETGPCGPCSEVHYFHGDSVDLSRFGAEPAVDGRGWTEIWNLVFMQYDRPEKDAAVVRLPAPCIDTGAGLERLAGVLQGVSSNYDTDVLRRLIDRAARLAGKTYGGTGGADDVSLRVIADHARTTAFLLAEGVMPDRQKREYVLRRVMRRAVRHGHRLGIERPFLHEVVREVVEAMGEDYPELGERALLLARVTEGEEERFRATLRRGIRLLDEQLEALRATGGRQVSAAVAADLYTTYGFPVDLTAVIAAEHGLGVDVAGAEEIVRGAERADGPIDPHAAVDPAHRAIAGLACRTEFAGYETERETSRILGLVRLGGDTERSIVQVARRGERAEIAVARTPFYAEAGGQVGDVGVVVAATGRALVTDAQRPFGEVTLHVALVEEGELRVGQEATLEVDRAARSATRRNHSATHLLHWALRTVLGEHAQQKGSRVGPDVLRFDFAHNQPMTRAEIERVEDLVGAKILTNAPIATEVLPRAEARARGAMAIFEEKYGETVRMVSMTADSVELCGGTHAGRLGDIGLFKILSEGGTAAGVRRIFAATGTNALVWVRELEHEMARARAAAKAPSGDLAERIEKLLAHERQLERRVAELERQVAESGGAAGGGAAAMLAGAREIAGVKVLARRVADGTGMATLRELAEKLRDQLGGPAAVLLAAVAEGKASFALMVSKSATTRLKAGALIKPVAALVGGSGGGRPDMAQAGGTEVARIDEAIAALYAEVEQALRGG
ncbi:MAG: alanine--tRNA ligase [Deltaproteobacteria bacterium]|nr:alanine--tRNA ligase [Deltaproteobacteria bacterium]